MKAIAIIPGTKGSHIVDRPEPAITAQDEVKVRVIRVGICGTDRTEVSGGRADAPRRSERTRHRPRDVWPGGGIGVVGNSRERWETSPCLRSGEGVGSVRPARWGARTCARPASTEREAYTGWMAIKRNS